ncbi:Lon protease family protein [Thermosulfurimonas sp. F29]|uniref:Lon protease family protein n=1 Tax=Thermosulfurimonas sp. F29 TaxID=2867247 RepID=UPI001C8314C8|nr:AAA family ATPase [Thermosulfurimonas sp. F29]MBX6422861.1 AAA family ATPase [Thermosulfurimonas sp. F29]
MGERRELRPEELRVTVDPASLGVSSSEDLLSGETPPIMGQERAVAALSLGLKLDDLDFHIYVAGEAEFGAGYLTRVLTEEEARHRPTPSDWCYVYNFEDPDRPLALELPAGKGREFKRDMADFIRTLRERLPEAFEDESYVQKKEALLKEFNQRRAQIFEALENRVKAEGFILNVEPMGMMIIPARPDGTPMTPQDVQGLPEEEKERLKAKSKELQHELNATVRNIQKLEKDLHEALRNLDREVASQVIQFYLRDLRDKYAAFTPVVEYLEAVARDVLEHLDEFRQPHGKEGAHPPFPVPVPPREPVFVRYEVNLFVDNSETRGAPVVFEPNPTYPRLFGAIERKAQFGALLTDFTMLRAGSLHRANGGFLILRALDLLRNPFSYETLKRIIKSRKIFLEDLGEQLGLFTTKTLRPKPIPFRAKVILIGDLFLYHLLYAFDETFRELFKVKAPLEEWVDRTEERTREFLRTVALMVRKKNLLPVSADGLARLVEYSCELAGRKDKLSLKLPEIFDTLREAHFWAQSEGASNITAQHIEKALEERRRRLSLIEDRLHEAIMKDLIRIRTEGEEVGSINGLSVYELGDYRFGRPTRITANVSLGREGVINIEREAELSGKIHTKGVMILSGFLRERFVQDKPLTLSATLCFEQSYGLVEGDSASSAELFALLSALAGVPIKQGIAVTGSVSQKGEIQPVGGVNEKIEGFFRVCAERGLTGEQGVIIPAANVNDLVLKKEVVEAVAEGKFHIWPISRVEEGIEILTGLPAGEPGPDGRYPEGTVFYLVDKRLRELAERARLFGKDAKKENAAE